MKTAKLVTRRIRPLYRHDCDECRFLGRLDGKDLYCCSRTGDFTARFGSGESQYGSLGTLTPGGSPYSLARQLLDRRLPPNEYMTA